MKTLFIFSDTHGNLPCIEKLSPIICESDYIVHLGDNSHDLNVLPDDVCEKIYSVKGNCDGGGEDIILEIENRKLLITHGDRYGVKSSLLRVLLKAKEIGADTVLYGHTHISNIEEVDGITLINPGNMTRFGVKSYCYAVISKDKITAKIVAVD